MSKSSAPAHHPEVAAGDGIAYAGSKLQAEPHGCYEGLVYIGHMDVDPETGDEVEVLDRVPCKRCNPR